LIRKKLKKNQLKGTKVNSVNNSFFLEGYTPSSKGRRLCSLLQNKIGWSKEEEGVKKTERK